MNFCSMKDKFGGSSDPHLVHDRHHRLILKGGQHPQLGRLILRCPAWLLTRRLIPSWVLIERIKNTHLRLIHSGLMCWLLLEASLCNYHFLSWLTAAAISLSANTGLCLDIRSWKWFDSQWFLSPIKLFWASSFAHCKCASVSRGRQQIAVPLALCLDLDRVTWDEVIYNWDTTVMCHDAGAQPTARMLFYRDRATVPFTLKKWGRACKRAPPKKCQIKRPGRC